MSPESTSIPHVSAGGFNIVSVLSGYRLGLSEENLPKSIEDLSCGLH